MDHHQQAAFSWINLEFLCEYLNFSLVGGWFPNPFEKKYARQIGLFA